MRSFRSADVWGFGGGGAFVQSRSAYKDRGPAPACRALLCLKTAVVVLAASAATSAPVLAAKQTRPENVTATNAGVSDSAGNTGKPVGAPNVQGAAATPPKPAVTQHFDIDDFAFAARTSCRRSILKKRFIRFLGQTERPTMSRKREPRWRKPTTTRVFRPSASRCRSRTRKARSLRCR